MTITPELEAMAQAILAKVPAGYGMTKSEAVEYARAALSATREPTESMLDAAFVAMNKTPSGTWKRMKAEGQTPRRIFDVKMAPRWRAMIAHITGEPS